MKTSTYSFGEDSPLKFEIPDKLAVFYNQAVEKYFKAQQRFNQKFGKGWDPTTDPIELNWTRKQRNAWNDFSRIFVKAITENGPYHPNDIMDDFLVKNGSGASGSSEMWKRIIAGAAASGAVYVLLRGL